MRRIDHILRGGLYRSRSGIFLGVCKGISGYFDFSLFWTRVIAIVLLIFSGFWPVLALYFIAALLMKPEPVLPIGSEEEEELYESYVASRKGATDRIIRRYKHLDRRIRRMEHIVTTKEFDWENRLNSEKP
jgi:phage shock protein C